MRQWAVLAGLALGCAPDTCEDCSDGGTTTPSTTAPSSTGPSSTGPSTDALLSSFYAEHGGRDAFPDTAAAALEALLYGQDEVAAGDYDGARARVDAIFADMPLSTDVWRDGVGLDGTNIGDPIAYYGLRMLDVVADGPPPSTGTLQLTAVVATCAAVTRPTLPDLAPETVDLELDPALLVDDARVLRVSTDLFRRWVTAITGGLEAELVVHVLPGCTTVDYTDDGAIIVSYPDAQGMIDGVPDDVAEATDFWWVVAPSGVPGDGSGYDRHFITGGMGGRGAAPLFLSDDGWFLRKPEHLGSGRYHEVEQRAYQPQWFQHEFMHHLFRTWPALGLEDAPHQWFDRSTWPADFEGVWEADYYAEAIAKRFGDVTPSLADGLRGPEGVDLDVVGLSVVAGDYERSPVENEWHEVTISVQGASAATWTNAAGVAWSLAVRDGELWTGPDCPYGEQELVVELGDDGQASVIWFGAEAYGRVGL
ncbi:MAG: hypothetical protein ACI8PZ_003280 [Myxococcota bacterium]|jgi:hypothetical protein